MQFQTLELYDVVRQHHGTGLVTVVNAVTPGYHTPSHTITAILAHVKL